MKKLEVGNLRCKNCRFEEEFYIVTYRTFRGIYFSIKQIARTIEWIKNKHGKCPRCGDTLFGGRLVIRVGKYGKFLGCSNYLKCKYTQNIL